MMSGIEAISIIGVVICIFGLIGTWVRNGRSQTAKFATLATQVKGIDEKLEDPTHGLSALNEKMGIFQTTCAGARASYDERIKRSEEDIKDLKRKRK